MSGQFDRMMQVVEKEDEILRRLTALTNDGVVEWSPQGRRVYIAQFKNSIFEFYALESMLLVDGQRIDTRPLGEHRSPSLFQNLDNGIQARLRPDGRRREVGDSLQEILDKLKAQ